MTVPRPCHSDRDRRSRHRHGRPFRRRGRRVRSREIHRPRVRLRGCRGAGGAKEGRSVVGVERSHLRLGLGVGLGEQDIRLPPRGAMRESSALSLRPHALPIAAITVNAILNLFSMQARSLSMSQPITITLDTHPPPSSAGSRRDGAASCRPGVADAVRGLYDRVPRTAHSTAPPRSCAYRHTRTRSRRHPGAHTHQRIHRPRSHPIAASPHHHRQRPDIRRISLLHHPPDQHQLQLFFRRHLYPSRAENRVDGAGAQVAPEVRCLLATPILTRAQVSCERWHGEGVLAISFALVVLLAWFRHCCCSPPFAVGMVSTTHIVSIAPRSLTPNPRALRPHSDLDLYSACRLHFPKSRPQLHPYRPLLTMQIHRTLYCQTQSCCRVRC